MWRKLNESNTGEINKKETKLINSFLQSNSILSAWWKEKRKKTKSDITRFKEEEP